MIRARPTTYNSVRFRSRLEAKWAAFFDLAGWAWEYEPVDTDGWVPDFLLRGIDTNTYVEVKPIEWVGQSVHSYERQAAERGDLDKVRESGRLALVLGLYPVPLEYDRPFVGLLLNAPRVGVDFVHAMAAGRSVDCAPDQSDVGLLSGVRLTTGAPWSIVGDLWRRASTLTQWRAA
jgi:hypothetical protein